MEKAFIIDLDGTVIDVSERSRIAEERQKEGEHFFDALFDPELVHLDTPIPGAKECLEELSTEGKIIYLSGRRSVLLDETLKWLEKHGYPKGTVILRKKGRLTKDFKAETIKHIQKAYDVVCGVGDNPEDIEAYRETGIPKTILVDTAKPWRDCPCLDRQSTKR